MNKDAVGADDQPGTLIDRHVGARLASRRMAAGLSISTVAGALGVTDGAIRSWETGLTRIPAGQLLMLSQLLSCPLTKLFEGFPAYDEPDDDVEPSEAIVNSLFSRYSPAKE